MMCNNFMDVMEMQRLSLCIQQLPTTQANNVWWAGNHLFAPPAAGQYDMK